MLLISLSLSYALQAIINPLYCYTPLVAIAQSNQAKIQADVTMQAVIAAAAQSAAASQSQASASPAIIPITPQNLGPTGDLVHLAGTYQIPSSLAYSGSVSALTIEQSNTTIDLNGQTIQFTGNSSQTVHGIIINPGISNITIKNGTIAGFSGSGIYAQATPENPINNIILDTVIVTSCTNGIVISGGNTISLNACTVSANTSNAAAPNYGISLTNCSGVRASNCISSYNTNSSDSCYGFFCSSCAKVLFNTCTAHGNSGYGKTVGFYFSSMIYNNYIKSCLSNGNMAAESNCYGFLIENSTFIFLEDSEAQCNWPCDTDYDSYGIRLSSSSTCFIKHNTVDCNGYGIYDDEPLGFHTNIFTQNIAYNNVIEDYLRPYSSPLTYVLINQEYLQGILQAGSLDNISIRISSS